MKKFTSLIILGLMSLTSLSALEPLKVAIMNNSSTAVSVQVKLNDYTGGTATTKYTGAMQSLTPNGSGIIIIQVANNVGTDWGDITATEVNSYYVLDVLVGGTLYAQYRLDQLILSQSQSDIYNNNGNLAPSTSGANDLGEDNNRWGELYVQGNTIHIGPDGGMAGTDELAFSYNDATNTATMTVAGGAAMTATASGVTIPGTLTQTSGNVSFGGGVGFNDGLVVNSGNVNIGSTNVDPSNGNTYVGGTLQVVGNTSLTGDFVTNGNVTLNGTIIGNNPFIFEGASNDNFETRIIIEDPTADRNITFPDADGTLALAGNIVTDASLTGNGTSGSPLAIDLTNSNAWSGVQTFNGATTNVSNLNFTSATGTITNTTFGAVGFGDDLTLTDDSDIIMDNNSRIYSPGGLVTIHDDLTVTVGDLTITNGGLNVVGNTIVGDAVGDSHIINGDLTLSNLSGGGTQNIQIDNTGKIVVGGASPFTHDAVNNKVYRNDPDDDFIFGDDDFDYSSTAPALESKMYYDDSKGAFRVGTVDNTHWNEANVGDNSFAAGLNTYANGNYAFAMGDSSRASGISSVAMGKYSRALNSYATAIGLNNEATNIASVALGNFVQSHGISSIALGDSSIATSNSSVAIGKYTRSHGFGSIAMGDSSISTGNATIAMGNYAGSYGSYASISIGDSTLATANYSISMGKYTQAHGTSSISMGDSTQATATYSIAMGKYARSNGISAVTIGDSVQAVSLNSMALGKATFAEGVSSTAMGLGTHAKSFAETVIGAYNTDYIPDNTTAWDTDDRLFVVGNGTNSANRSNAFEVYKNGDVVIPTLAGGGTQNIQVDNTGKIVVGGASPFTHDAVNNRVYRNDPDDDFIFGDDDFNHSSGSEMKMFFDKTKGSFRAGTVTGTAWDDANIGNNSFASGINTTASGNNSIAMGVGAVANNANSTAIGGSTASGINSLAMGTATTASGDFSSTMGVGTRADENESTSIGMYNDETITGEIFTVGNGTNSSNRSNAFEVYKNGNVVMAGSITANPSGADKDFIFGDYDFNHSFSTETKMFFDKSKGSFRAGTVAGNAWDEVNIGTSSIALGNNSTASGNNSTALGNNAIASGSASTAMGVSTTASGAFSTAMGYNTISNQSYSTAMGHSTTASGIYSTAMGNQSVSSNIASTSMGFQTTASGNSSTAMGVSTTASGDFSTTMGNRTLANESESVAMGMYNDYTITGELLTIGNGTGNTARTNAFEVYKNGNVVIGDDANATHTVRGIMNMNQGINANGSSSSVAVHFSATAPSSPLTGSLWYDTGASALKIWNGGAWVNI